MKNIPQYLMYVLLVLGGVVALLSVFSESHEPILLVMKVLTVVCFVIMAGSYLFDMVVKPETIKEILGFMIALVVIFGISYALAGDEMLEKYPKGFTPGDSKMAGAGLIMFYILGALAVGSIAITSLFNAIKNK